MQKKGFTIIEVLVAILIFAVGIMSAFVLVNTAISLSVRSKQEIIATNILREQIELVKNVRDTNWLALRDWNAFSGTLLPGESCTLCSFTPDQWLTVSNRYNGTHPVSILPINSPALSLDEADRRNAVLSIANLPNHQLRLCLDAQNRYISCSNGGIPTPYYAYFHIGAVKSHDASGAELVIPGILELTAYFATTEWGYREFSFGSYISDWKR